MAGDIYAIKPGLQTFEDTVRIATSADMLSSLTLPGVVQHPQYTRMVMGVDARGDALEFHATDRGGWQRTALSRCAAGEFILNVYIGEGSLQPRGNWKTDDRRQALEYIEALIEGHPLMRVRILPESVPFSRANVGTCHRMVIPDGAQVIFRGGGPRGTEVYWDKEAQQWASGVFEDADTFALPADLSLKALRLRIAEGR